MKQKLAILSLFTLIILCGCTAGNGLSQSSISTQTSSSSSAIPKTEPEIKIELLKAMDVTNLSYMEPFDENTVYIIGAKRDKSLPSRELVYAICSLDTGDITVLHREIISIDWADNIDTYVDKEGKVKLFTGQQILTIDKSKVESVENIVDAQCEVFVDLENSRMAFTENTPPSLFYGAIGSDDKTLIFESKKVEIEGNEADLFPYRPRINDDGDKILYGTALDDTSQYQKVAIRSVDGSMIAETDKLKNNADYLDVFWFRDGFVTLELTEDYVGSPTGHATFLTKYNSRAEEVSRTVLHGAAHNYQKKFYPDISLFALAYKTESTKGLALWDAVTQQVYYVRDVEGHALDPTVTPNGSKILWFFDGYLCADPIDLDSYEKIPTYAPAESTTSAS